MNLAIRLRRWSAAVVLLALPAFGSPSLSPGWQSLLAGDLAGARRAFEQALEKDPADADAAVGLALAFKHGGDPEKALFAAAEGLKAAPGHPLAFLLEAQVSEGATFNEATVRLVEDSLPLLSDAPEMDPLVRLNLHWLGLNLASRRGEAGGRMAALRRAGFLPGAFFSPPLTERPRTAFEEGAGMEPPALKGLGPWAYSALDGPLLRPPLYAMAQDRESRFYAAIPFEADGEAVALLAVNAARSFRVFLDGRPLAEKDVFRRQENPTALLRLRLERGRHLILVEVAASGPGDGVYAALLDGAGRALPVRYLDDPASLEGPFAGFSEPSEFADAFTARFPKEDPRYEGFLALWNRWRGDVALARLQMEKAAEGPQGVLWGLEAAEMYLFEADDLPRKIAGSRAEKVLEKARAASPACPSARFLEAILLSENSEADRDLDLLRRLLEEYPRDPRWGLALAQGLHRRGWNAAARRVLEEVAQAHPQCEAVESAWVSLLHDVGDRAGEREAILRLQKLRRADPEWEAYHRARGDLAALRALLEEERGRWGDRDLQIALAIARTDLGLLDLSRADAEFAALAERMPASPEVLLSRARIAFLQGDGERARSFWKALKKARPDAFDVDVARMALGDPLPFQDSHVDLAALLEKEKGREADPAPSSLLLDQLFTRIEEDGSSVERYHTVIRINDKSGVEGEGEQQIPGQILLSLRTVKPDGRVLEPEVIPEKDTVSLQGLEPGDLIEYEYIGLRPPNRVKDRSYITTQVFLFQDIEKPFHRTEWTLEYPPSLEMRFLERNLPAPAEQGRRGDYLFRRWAYRDMPRIAPEPDLPNKLLFVPMVEAAGGLDWKDVALFLKETVTGTYQVTPEVERRYREVSAGATGPEDLLDRLVRACLSDVEGEGGGWQDPTDALLNRRGARLPLLCAYLTLAGIPYEILMAEPVPERIARESLPRLGQFQVPLVKVTLPSGERYLVLASPHRAPSVLPWYLEGAEALPVTAKEPWRVVTLPSDFGPWLAAGEKETREVGREGDLKVSYRARLDPDGAEGIRSSLARVPADQRRKALQMALSQRYGSADLEEYAFEGLEDAASPLIWTYTVSVYGAGSVEGNRITFSDPLPALNLGKAYGSLEARRLPLGTGGPVFLHQEITFRFPEGASAEYRPRSASVKSPFGEYSLEVRREKGEITVERRLVLPNQVVEPARYGAFRRFLLEVDRAESGQMTVVLPPG